MIKIILKEEKTPNAQMSNSDTMTMAPKPISAQEQIVKKFEEELSKNKLSPISVVYLLYRAGFRGNDLLEGTHIVLGESMGNPSLEQSKRNKDGTTDHGLWQINDKLLSGTTFYDNVKNEIEARFKEAIEIIKLNKRLTPEQKQQKIQSMENNKKKQLEKMSSGYGIPFISREDALDPIKATNYVKFRMQTFKKKYGEDKKWSGWVPSLSKLVVKYGADKQEMAKEAVKQFSKFFK